MHLYELKQLYIDTLDDIEDVAEYKGVLDSIEDEFQNKGLAVLAYYKNAQVDIEAFKAAEKSIKLRRDALTKRNEALKQYLLTNMLGTGITSLESPFFSCKVKNNPPHIEVLNEALIPDKFKQEIISTRIDKAAIKKYAKEHGSVPGVDIVRDKSLQIK